MGLVQNASLIDTIKPVGSVVSSGQSTLNMPLAGRALGGV